jgi:hypothetical protein
MAKDVLNSNSLSEYHEKILKEVLEGTYRPPNLKTRDITFRSGEELP